MRERSVVSRQSPVLSCPILTVHDTEAAQRDTKRDLVSTAWGRDGSTRIDPIVIEPCPTRPRRLVRRPSRSRDSSRIRLGLVQ
jgi:hypothetical protein